MRQIITLAILAAIAVAGWFSWPTIKAKFLASQEGNAPQKGPEVIPSTPPGPNPSGVTPPAPSSGAKTSDPTIPMVPEAKTAETSGPSGTNEKTPALPSDAKPLRVELTAELVTNGVVSGIEGTTTLPVGSTLIMQFNAELGKRTRLEVPFVTGITIPVVAGSPRNVFRATALQFPAGKSFRLWVTLNPDTQRADVQQLIGPHGELLIGGLLIPRAGGNCLAAVSAPFQLTVAGPASAKARRTKLVFKPAETE